MSGVSVAKKKQVSANTGCMPLNTCWVAPTRRSKMSAPIFPTMITPQTHHTIKPKMFFRRGGLSDFQDRK